MYAIDPLRTASQAQTSPLTEVNKELSLAGRCAQHVHVSTVWYQRWWPMQGVHTALHHKDFAPVRPFHIRKGWRPLQTKQTVCFVEHPHTCALHLTGFKMLFLNVKLIFLRMQCHYSFLLSKWPLQSTNLMVHLIPNPTSLLFGTSRILTEPSAGSSQNQFSVLK